MRKLFTFFAFMLLFGIANSQNNFEINVADIADWQNIEVCFNDYDSVIVVSDDEYCETFIDEFPRWHVVVRPSGTISYDVYGTRLALPVSQSDYYEIRYIGVNDECLLYYREEMWFYFPDLPSSNFWSQDYEWKRMGTTASLCCPYGNFETYHYEWSTGLTYQCIGGLQAGTYWARVYSACGEVYDTVQIRDNVDLYRATVDLATNLNKTTWQVTDEQAEYISEVKVYRDGLFVGTAPYGQGYFLDAIGSNNAARNYRIVGVSVEGEDCPFESYEKGTIHTTYYQDVNGNLNMTWNIPYVEEGAQGTLTYFQICKYNPSTGELVVVDQVNASITDYTCGVNQFDGGQAVIAAVFSDDKGVEDLAFSNLTENILAVGENEMLRLEVYPNPANGVLTVEGTGRLTIMNLLGQEILTQEIDGKTTQELPRGIYFVKLGSAIKKIVVE